MRRLYIKTLVLIYLSYSHDNIILKIHYYQIRYYNIQIYVKLLVIALTETHLIRNLGALKYFFF